MNQKLRETIAKVKYELSKEPSSVIIGKINDGFNEEEKSISIQPYCDFLDICNGARCGIIDLWSNEDLKNHQYSVTDLAGGSEKWLCIGQILYEPLVFNLDDKKVYLFYQGCETEVQRGCFGQLEEFLSYYVFGEQYKELSPDGVSDEWYIFIEKIGLFSRSEENHKKV